MDVDGRLERLKRVGQVGAHQLKNIQLPMSCSHRAAVGEAACRAASHRLRNAPKRTGVVQALQS